MALQQYRIDLLYAKGNYFIYRDGDVLHLSEDHGATYTKSMSIAGVGTIKHLYMFENGNFLFCTQREAYYSTNFSTYTASTVLDDKGVPVTFTTGFEHFYGTTLDVNPSIHDGQEMLVWGNYTTLEGVQYVNVRIWYTVDFGKTIKMAYKFRDTNSVGSNPNLYVRHVHCVHYNHHDQSFWAMTGDEPSGVENRHVMKGLYNRSNDTWTWTVIGSGAAFKWGNAAFYDGYIYFAHDVSGGGIKRVKYEEAGDVSKHVQLMTTPNDTSCMVITYSGEMIVTQSYWGGSDARTNIWYSPDRVNFTKLTTQFPAAHLNQFNYYDRVLVTSQNRVSLAINDVTEANMHLWTLKPRVFVDQYVRDAGFPNAFAPHLTPPPEVIGIGRTIGNNSITLNWANPKAEFMSHVRILRNGTVLSAKHRGTSFVDTTAAVGASYTYTVQTVDYVGNVSTGMAITSDGQVSVPNPDTGGFTDKMYMKRGLKATIPALDEGELGFCTDTKELYIGSSTGNVLLNPPQ